MSLQTTQWLTTGDLERFIKNHANARTKAAFIGVFAIDQLPHSVPNLPTLLIINTDTINLPGKHWKAVFIDEKKRGEIFDSLAAPISLRLEKWMNKMTKKWTRCFFPIQHPLSPSCGAYVLYYVLTRLSCKSLDAVLGNFSIDVNKNEKIVQSFMEYMSL